MGYSIYYSKTNSRYQGYAVTAVCDHPECETEIDRGIGYLCCENPNHTATCGKFFCSEHRENYIYYDELADLEQPELDHLGLDSSDLPIEDDEPVYTCKHDSQVNKELVTWLNFILHDESWHEWRNHNPMLVQHYQECINANTEHKSYVLVNHDVAVNDA